MSATIARIARIDSGATVPVRRHYFRSGGGGARRKAAPRSQLDCGATPQAPAPGDTPTDCVSFVSLAFIENSAAYSTPPPYDEIEHDLDGPGAAREPGTAARTPTPRKPTRREELAEALRETIVGHVLRRHDGRLHPKASLAALVALAELLAPSGKSLRTLARECDCTAALLSLHGLRLADKLGLRARWQRPERRAADAARQRAVARGQHTPTPKWERRRLVLARRQRDAA